MTPEWRTPAAVLLGCAMIAGAVLVTRPNSVSSVAAPPSALATPPASVSPPIPAPIPAPPPAAESSSAVELPIVTYDSFDRRFTGKLLEEAEAKCWAPAQARHAVDDIVYLFLDVAADGTVEKVELDEPPPNLPDPERDTLHPLNVCVAAVAKKVRFMALPAPVRGARVAAHRHVQKH